MLWSFSEVFNLCLPGCKHDKVLGRWLQQACSCYTGDPIKGSSIWSSTRLSSFSREVSIFCWISGLRSPIKIRCLHVSFGPFYIAYRHCENKDVFGIWDFFYLPRVVPDECIRSITVTALRSRYHSVFLTVNNMPISHYQWPLLSGLAFADDLICPNMMFLWPVTWGCFQQNDAWLQNTS